MKDSFGNEITCDDPEIIQLVDKFTVSLLDYSKNFDQIFSKLQESNCATVHIYKAIVSIFIGKIKEAEESLEKAKKLEMNEREEMNLKSLYFWTVGKIEQCIDQLVQISKKYPTDVVAVYVCYQHYIYGGRMKELLNLVENILPYHENNSYILGMYCFGLEENSQFEKAEEVGLKAIKINENDPWNHHSICHVYDTVARLDDGIHWMETYSSKWEDCNNFMKCHNWWHLSLLYLEKSGSIKEKEKKMMEFYNEKVWIENKDWKSDPSVIVSAISLLWRMELQGFKITKQWDDVVDYVKPHCKEHVWSYMDLHYLYALSRKNETERVEQMIDEISPTNQFITNTAKSISYFAMDNFEKSLKFTPDASDIWKIGGSNAQRSVFDLTIIDTLQKNKKYSESKKLFDLRINPMKDHFSYTLRKQEYEYSLGMNQNFKDTIFYKEQLMKYPIN